MSGFDEIYGKLLMKYRATHQNSIDGLANRLNQLTNEGRTWEEAVLYFSLDLGVEIPEIRILIEGGKSQDEAIRIVSKDLETERQVQDIFRLSKPSQQEYKISPSRLLYLLPVFFSLLGGIVVYVVVKNEDWGMANTLLNPGIIVFAIYVAIAYFICHIWLPSLFW